MDPKLELLFALARKSPSAERTKAEVATIPEEFGAVARLADRTGLPRVALAQLFTDRVIGDFRQDSVADLIFQSRSREQKVELCGPGGSVGVGRIRKLCS
jgi:hypothetical protein